MIMTSCVGGVVKLWTPLKQLLREIQFVGGVDAVCFLNDKGDILVGHDKRISVIKFENYWPEEKVLRKLRDKGDECVRTEIKEGLFRGSKEKKEGWKPDSGDDTLEERDYSKVKPPSPLTLKA